MSQDKIYTDYFFNKHIFDLKGGGYIPLENSDAPQSPLRVPEILQPDKETPHEIFYTVKAQTGEAQILPGKKTKTWGYNSNFLGKTIVFKRGKTIHAHLVNNLPEVTSFHWHGLDIPGPIEDGGCHAIIYPGKSKDISFKVDQPASMCWLHAHPCPETAAQVWRGLVAPVIILDDEEAKLPLPRNYGVDDIPLILQDRTFHQNNQLDYKADYNPDGVYGKTPLIDGTINPYFDVTTQKLRLRILNGSNRREWRLHFSNDLQFTEIASDDSLLTKPVKFTHLMITCAERHEIIVDFKDYRPGDEVILFSDKTPIVKFKVHKFQPDNTKLPDHLLDLSPIKIDSSLPIHQVYMSGMDESVMMDNKKFNMSRIDYKINLNEPQIWEIHNIKSNMDHPFHMHGTSFRVISRSGNKPYPNETGLKDTIGVDPGEHVFIRVQYKVPGIFMYHCHILEHEDGGMMEQLKVIDPNNPNKKYKLMDHKTLLKAFAKERNVSLNKLWLGGMQSYEKMNMPM